MLRTRLTYIFIASSPHMKDGGNGSGSIEDLVGEGRGKVEGGEFDGVGGVEWWFDGVR